MRIAERLKFAFSALRGLSPENPSTSFSEWLDGLSGGPSVAGVNVTNESANRVTAVYACIRILAESVASLPLHVYERMEDGGRRKAPEHPLHRVLHDEPNSIMSSFTFFETATAHAVGHGNGYAQIRRDGAGRVRALWPIKPSIVTPKLKDNTLVYEVDGRGNAIRHDSIVHVQGMGSDGVQGYNPIALAREAVGLAFAAERTGAALFGNGSRPSGILSTEQELDPEQREALRVEWERLHGGSTNANRTAIVDGGLTWQQTSMSNEDSQFLETRKFQVTEIARLFRIPPHMLADLDRATFSNIEHQDLAFIKHTLRPWLVRWEKELNRKLLLPSERVKYFIEFNVDGFERGDLASRAAALTTMTGGPIMATNEARALMNLPKKDGGDTIRTPLNMTELGDEQTEQDDEAA